MASLRPFINTYEAGELAPDMAGMLDRQIYAQGAKELTNFEPGRGARKRDSLEYVMAFQDQTSEGRGINWSVGERNFQILFSDGLIKILDTTDEDAPTYLQEDGSDIEITYLDGTSEIYSAYAEADIPYIQYAKSNNDIVFVCDGRYPAFHINLTEIDNSTGEVVVEYGIIGYTGNVAKSPDPNDVDEEAESIPAEDLLYAVRNLELDTLYAAAGYVEIGGTNYTVTGVTLSGEVQARYAEIRAGYVSAQTVLDSESALFPASVATVYGRSEKVSWFVHYWRTAYFSTTASMTKTAFLDKCQEYLTNGQTYALDDTVKSRNDAWSPVSFYNEVDNRTLTIHFSDHADLEIEESSDEIVGLFEITALGKTIDTGAVDGQEILDKTIPWMEPDVDYFCDSEYTINGVAPVIARRVDNSGEPSLELYFEANENGVTITKNSPGIQGRVGVILTPFYDRAEHPTAVCYHQNRLVLASKNRIFISKSNDHSNFTYFDELQYESAVLADKPWTDPNVPEYNTEINTTQQVSADSAIRYSFSTEEDETIRWLVSHTDLIIGTATSEWIIPGALDATKIPVASVSRRGSSYVQARSIGQLITFVSGSARKLWGYNSQLQDQSPDLMQYADHIARDGIKYIDFRQDPRDEIVLTTHIGTVIKGQLNESSVAWYRIECANDDEIESAWVSAGEREDLVYCIVKRTIGASTIRSLEVMKTRFPETEFAGKVCMDFVAIFESIASTPVTGLTRFFGASNLGVLVERAGVFTWGVPVINSSGQCWNILPNGSTELFSLAAGDNVAFGLIFDARLETFRIDSPEIEGRFKAGGNVDVRLYCSGKFDIGSPYGDLQEIRIPDYDTVDSVYPYTGIVSALLNAPHKQDHSVVVESSTPLRVQILSITPEYDV